MSPDHVWPMVRVPCCTETRPPLLGRTCTPLRSHLKLQQHSSSTYMHHVMHSETQTGRRRGLTHTTTQTDKNVPDVDSRVVCGVADQTSRGPFDNTLVCRRHRDDGAICTIPQQVQRRRVKAEKEERRKWCLHL